MQVGPVHEMNKPLDAVRSLPLSAQMVGKSVIVAVRWGFGVSG